MSRLETYLGMIDQQIRSPSVPISNFFRNLVQDLDARLSDTEQAAADFRAENSRLEAVALTYLASKLEPEFDRVRVAADLGQLFEASSTSALTVGTGEVELVVADADKGRFSAPGYILIRKVGVSGVWMLGQKVSYDRPSGLLVVDVERVSGLGETASAWSIAAASEGAVPTASDGDYTAGQVVVSPTVLGENRAQGVLAALATALNYKPSLASLGEMKAIVPAAGLAVFLLEAGREGIFLWSAGDYSAHVAADALGAVFVASNTVASSSGAWVRAAHSVEWLPSWFGARFDGVTDDTAALNAWISLGLAVGRRSFVFPSGTTLVGGILQSQAYAGQSAGWVDKFIFLITGIDEVVYIKISATKFLIAGGERGEWGNLFGCTNGGGIVIFSESGFVDYVNLPFVQGTLISSTATTATFELDDDTPFPSWDNVQRIEEIDDSDVNYGPRFIKNILVTPYTLSDGRSIADVSGNLVVTVSSSEDQASLATMTVGNRYILTHQIYGADIVHTRRVKTMQILGDLTVYATAGMLIRTTNCDTVDFSGLRALRKPGTNRAVVAPGGGMILSDVVDNVRGVGFHFERLYDDPINISCFRLLVSGTAGDDTALFTDLRYPYQPPEVGDELFWVDATTGTIQSIGTIVSIFWNGSALETEMSEDLPAGFGSGDYVITADKCPRVHLDAFKIEHCRGHGVLVQSEDVFVRGRVANCYSSGVSVWRNPSYFSEAGIIGKVHLDVDVYDCTRGTASPGAVGVWAAELDGDFEKSGNINNVTIRGKIEKCDQAAVFVSSCDDVSVDVVVDDSNRNPNLSLWGGSSAHAVSFVNCGDVSVSLVNRDENRSVGVLGTITQVRQGKMIRASILPETVPSVAGIRLKATTNANVDFLDGNPITGFTATQSSAVAYDNSTGVITVSEPGRYQIIGKITVAGNSSAGDGSIVLKHTPFGASEYDLDYIMIITATTEIIPGSIYAEEYLKSGDTLRLVAVDATGSPTGVRVSMYPSFTHLCLRRIG